MSYLQTVEEFYSQAAAAPQANLCCAAGTVWRLPDLILPRLMLEMNYGCGSAVEPRDLKADDTILYIGVGGGLEALQFAYFTRRPGAVIAVDPVQAMRDKAQENLLQAARLNPWFRPDFVKLLEGSALDLPIPSASVTVAAQNCLFNIFRKEDLERALSELFRVLKPGGFFATADPITPRPLPEAFSNNDLARAHCLSGCLTLDDYLTALSVAGFCRIEIRSRFPYRYLTPQEYPELEAPVLLESMTAVAYKMPPGPDGPEIFTGRTAIYIGPEETWEDGCGQVLPRGVPLPISEAAAHRLGQNPLLLITGPSYHARGGGCC